MLFNSLSFILFFAITYFVFLIVPRRVRAYALLTASYIFYMFWNPYYALLLLASTIITFICGLLIEKWGKTALVTSLILNLSILIIFKYLGFITYTVAKIVSLTGFHFSIAEINILLPVGISFYVFQAIGYTIDVYRKEITPEKNFFYYALFVSFFPQLVAGPIERSGRILFQLHDLQNKKAFDFERIQSGLITALFGFFLKMVIADRASIFVDSVFDAQNYSLYYGITSLVAILLFTLQIYCDFAGYTYIAIGVARILGIELCQNFNQPYFARNLKDFWGRWHMSLTSWFKDYLYIPLGGNKKGTVRKYTNIFIVFFLSGLWHGAAWHYVVWGMIHGIGRIVGEMTHAIRMRMMKFVEANGILSSNVFSYRLGQNIATFIFVSVAWLFFRAESTAQALAILKGFVFHLDPWVLTDGSLLSLGLDGKQWNILIFSVVILIVVDVINYMNIDLVSAFLHQNAVFKIIILWSFIMFIILAGVYGPGYDSAQFIYFQF